VAKPNHADDRGGSAPEGAAATCVVLGPVEPPVGGVSRYCRGLAALLESSGEPAVQLDLGKTSSRELGIHRSPLRRLVKRAVGGAAYALRSTVDRHRPRLVVDSHEFLWRDPDHAGATRKIVNCPYVLAIHDGRFPELAREDRERGVSFEARLGWIAGAVCMSRAIEAALAEFAPSVRIRRLSPLIERGRPGETAPGLSARVAAFFERHPTVIATSGALVEHYGLTDLLEAYARLRAGERPVGLVLLLGSFGREDREVRALEDALRRWGEDSILALTDHADGPAVIARSDVYVRPSRVDSFGLGLYEAMQAAVPAVAASHPTRPEGVLQYRPGDVAGLVAALEEAMLPRSRHAAAALAPGVRELADTNRRETLDFLRSCMAEPA